MDGEPNPHNGENLTKRRHAQNLKNNEKSIVVKRFHSFLKITKDLVPIIKQLKSDIANPRSFPSHFLKRISVASGANNDLL